MSFSLRTFTVFSASLLALTTAAVTPAQAMPPLALASDQTLPASCKFDAKELTPAELQQLYRDCDMSVQSSTNRVTIKGQDISRPLYNEIGWYTIESPDALLMSATVDFQFFDTPAEFPTPKCFIEDSRGLTFEFDIYRKTARLELIATPVRVRCQGLRYNAYFNLKEVSYNVSKLMRPDLKTTSWKIPNGSGNPPIQTIFTRMPDVQVSFVAELKVFKNYLSDSCSGRLLLQDSKGNKVDLNAKLGYFEAINWVTPITVKPYKACESSPLASPESNDLDLSFTLPYIWINTPSADL